MSKYNHPLDRASNSIPNDMVLLNKNTDISAPIALLKAALHTHDIFMKENKENIPPVVLKHLTETRDDIGMVYSALTDALRVKLKIEVTLQ